MESFADLFADRFVDSLLDPLTNAPLTTVRDDLGLRASVGISVFWKSPLGPLRFDIAEPVAKEPYDVTQVFRFSTTTKF